MKTSTNFNYLSTSVKELLPKSRNFISYSFKTIWLLLIAVVFFAATSCEEEEASTNNCDAQIDNLTTILTTKSNAFATNSSVTSCQEFRSAYLNLFNKMTQCGYPTTTLDADYDFVQNLDCSIFVEGGGGGNGGGGNGGGTGSSGTAMIWTQVDHGCGSISVTVNGSTQTISSYYSSGAPSCGAAGCASFTLSPGTYSVAASCSGSSWNGSITVTSGGCARLKLN